jgi:hypothetical protein
VPSAGALMTGLGMASVAMPATAFADDGGPGSGAVGQIYPLQAAFHRAKTTQDIDLMMSLWDPGMAPILPIAGSGEARRAISVPLTPVTRGLSRSLADTPPRRSGPVAGRMAQIPKLIVRVRFPSPAPVLRAQVGRCPASAAGSVLGGPLYSEIVRPRSDADHLNKAFSTLEVVWVGRI